MPQAVVSSEKLKKPTLHSLLSTKQMADTVNKKLVNILERLAAKEPDIFHRDLAKEQKQN